MQCRVIRVVVDAFDLSQRALGSASRVMIAAGVQRRIRLGAMRYSVCQGHGALACQPKGCEQSEHETRQHRANHSQR